MIELINISKSYNGKVKAVDNLTLNIPDGQIVGFLGPNGAGKTTTIKLLTGILNPDEGQIKLNEIDLKVKPLAAKKIIGFVPDSPDMFLRLKGIEYLNFMADMYDVSTFERKIKIEEFVSKFEMTQALNNKIQSYSHGMRQKIIIIGALIHDPLIWILDEPMMGLDPKSSFILKETLREYAQKNRTVFFSTHILEVAEKICDRVAVINKGKLLFNGTIEEMREQYKTDESLEKMFLELTEDR
jgi:ABC-2 type transport system ATP-binding protein